MSLCIELGDLLQIQIQIQNRWNHISKEFFSECAYSIFLSTNECLKPILVFADDSNQRDVTGLWDEGLSQTETFINYCDQLNGKLHNMFILEIYLF